MTNKELRQLNQMPFEGVSNFTLSTIIGLVVQGKISLDQIAEGSAWHNTFPDEESKIKAKVLEAVWFITQECGDTKNVVALTATIFHQLSSYLQ